MSERRHARGPAVGRAIGWIGLGAIGLPMARRAASAGWQVFAFDPSPERQDAARAAGLNLVASITEVAARGGDLVVCVVRTLGQVDEVLLGDDGILGVDDPPLAVVMSSVGAAGLADLARRAGSTGGRLVDAPILGNPAGAAAGTLTLVVSGTTHDVATARPLLADLAASVVVLGEEIGLGQTVKMVSQLRQIVGMVATIEGVELATRRGADEQAVLAVLSATEPSWATEHWAYASRLWEGRDRATSLGIFAKDLAAAVSDAEAAGLGLPLTQEAHRLIEERLEARDLGDGQPRDGS